MTTATITTAQHTPGPWFVKAHPAGCFFEIANQVKCDSGHIWIASANTDHGGDGFPTDSEGAANARLIAAAPDLLKALQNIVMFHDGDEDFVASLADESASLEENPSTAVWRERLIDNARAAIAKAEGAAQ